MTAPTNAPIPNCRTCSLTIQPGQLFVGLPILRISNTNKSVMTGGEVLFHLLCFLDKVKDMKSTLEIPQIFLSQIEMILKRWKCATHPQTFDAFVLKHEINFRKSEEIAAWINGFKK